MWGAFVSSSGAGLQGSDAACMSVRVGVRGLLSGPEREEGLAERISISSWTWESSRGHLAPFLLVLEAGLLEGK